MPRPWAPPSATPARVNVNLVQVPATVTDPMNRLVTGLEKENFASTTTTSARPSSTSPARTRRITIGVVFDLSGSMSSKFVRARKALTEFLRTSNPQDEFFVVGFNDRPAVIVDYTSDPDDVEARMVMLKPENRTALIDAVYLGVDHLRQAKYERKALLIISDGGDNRSRYTEGELRASCARATSRSTPSASSTATPQPPRSSLAPLLNEICEMTGGRLFKSAAMSATCRTSRQRISAELRNQYVIGYTPSEVKRDGNWRKLKVRLTPPPGLPQLTVHFRQGYYAPSE
jgi:Ca-activated chloride channel family protein